MILFEKEVKFGKIDNDKITFAELTEMWKTDYAEKRLAFKTYSRYLDYLARIIPAIGHIKLKNLTPIHLNRLYDDLGQDGVSKRTMRDSKGNIIPNRRLAEKTFVEHHRVSCILVIFICYLGRTKAALQYFLFLHYYFLFI